MHVELENRRSHRQIETPGDLVRWTLPLAAVLAFDLKFRSKETYSGSAGNNTYAHNLGGPYIRIRTIPTNPNSERQSEVRSFLGNFATKWNNLLTQVQRDAWRTYAENHTITDSLGFPIHLPPHCWYIMFNSRLQDAGAAAITDPPSLEGPTGFDTCTAAFTADNAIDLTFTPALFATERVQLWQTLPVSTGSSPNFNQARLVGYSAAAQASPWSATLAHAIPAMKRAVFFACIMDVWGQVSAKFTDIEDR